jgi:hypothetical protein
MLRKILKLRENSYLIILAIHILKLGIERIASWEDNKTRKDPNTIYLFLSTLDKGLKQGIT